MAEDAEHPNDPGKGDVCFLLNQSADGGGYGDVEGSSYSWTNHSSGARKKLASAEGARFAYYRTGSASDGTAQHFFGHGTIGPVTETKVGTDTEYTAQILNYEPFAIPVPLREGPPKNPQTSIQTVDPAEFDALIEKGFESNDTRVVVAYVGQQARRNFEFGIKTNSWGFTKWGDGFEELDEGDWILLGFGFTGGSVRTSPENWSKHQIEEVWVAQLKGGPRDETTPHWPDEIKEGEVKYPVRVKMRPGGERHSNVPTESAGPLGAAGEALRMSAIAQGGRVVQASDVPVLTGDKTHGPVGATVNIPASAEQLANEFGAVVEASGLVFEDDLVRAFLAAVATKPFAILSGLSGSGKTQIAKRLGQWFGDDNYAIVAVRPDWTGPEHLFGFEDGLRPPIAGHGRPWHTTKALRFMLQASANPHEPHLLVLDEMNLAHVERYFADFLSGVESTEPVLPNLKEVGDDFAVPAGQAEEIPIPKNLVVVGTVNVDETTYMFSPKVLDRANTFEFRVSPESLGVGITGPPGDTENARPEALAGFLEILHGPVAPPSADLTARLRRLHAGLRDDGFEFGHRVFAEGTRFVSIYRSMGASETEALDRLVLQKVLPRIHGARAQVDRPLARIVQFCSDPDATLDAESAVKSDAAQPPAVLPLASDKARRMIARMNASQFTGFTD